MAFLLCYYHFLEWLVVTRARLFHSQLVRNTLIIKCLFENKGHKEKPAMTTTVMPPSLFLMICASKQRFTKRQQFLIKVPIFLSRLCAQEMLGQVYIARIIKYSFTEGGHAVSGGF